jgi:hypothetical protein
MPSPKVNWAWSLISKEILVMTARKKRNAVSAEPGGVRERLYAWTLDMRPGEKLLVADHATVTMVAKNSGPGSIQIGAKSIMGAGMVRLMHFRGEAVNVSVVGDEPASLVMEFLPYTK